MTKRFGGKRLLKMVEKKTEDKENTSSYEITTNLIFLQTRNNRKTLFYMYLQ